MKGVLFKVDGFFIFTTNFLEVVFEIFCYLYIIYTPASLNGKCLIFEISFLKN